MQSRQSQQKTLLVVDDDLDILDFLHDLLSMEGYRVLITTKTEALEQLQRDALPDLILLDVFLSGRDGREVTRHLKSQEETRTIPIIMFSAYPNVKATVQAAGADAFIEKPFDMDILVTKIAHFLC